MFRRHRTFAAAAVPAATAAHYWFSRRAHCEDQQKAAKLRAAETLTEQRATSWEKFYSEAARPPAARPRPRVLVTGFHDWRELDNNIWRCRDNPSCRLLYGPPCPSPPIEKAGPLVRALQALGVEADFSFQSLPVVWGTAGSCDPLSFDLVVHMGLGVYDSHETILLECGAYNERRGADALGHAVGAPLDAGAPQVLAGDARMARTCAALQGTRLAGGHELRVAEARPANAYICNETHWRALKAVAHAAAFPPATLKAAYFVHVPYAAEHDPAHEALAASVAGLIGQLVARL